MAPIKPRGRNDDQIKTRDWDFNSSVSLPLSYYELIIKYRGEALNGAVILLI